MTLIGIDCRFASQKVGLGTYTKEMVIHLVHCQKDSYVLFVRNLDEQWLDHIPSHVTIIHADFDHYSIKEQLYFPMLMRQCAIDILFSPHFNIPFFCPVPFVVTIHDLILHRYPNTRSFVKQCAYKLLMHRAIVKSKHIIAVSAYTKSEILSHYGKNIFTKLSIITEGVNPIFTEKTQPIDIFSKYIIPRRYFLYVGNAKKHKNVQMLIDAHAQLKDAPPLILISNGIEATRLSLHHDVILLQDVPFDDLPSFYKQALCFITPSLYEGFCLPILEARACGCPVIASNTTAIPEVACPYSILVEPTSSALSLAMSHPPKQSSPPEEKYNWESSAIALSAILSRVYGKN